MAHQTLKFTRENDRKCIEKLEKRIWVCLKIWYMAILIGIMTIMMIHHWILGVPYFQTIEM